jgi:hypothetical protein
VSIHEPAIFEVKGALCWPGVDLKPAGFGVSGDYADDIEDFTIAKSVLWIQLISPCSHENSFRVKKQKCSSRLWGKKIRREKV